MNDKPSYGVLVGRFQVHDLTEGHMELIRTVRGRHTRTIIFIGTAPSGMTRHNPLDFIARKGMIQARFADITVIPLGDTETDEQWSRILDSKIQEFVGYGDVTLYGSRDSFIPHYSGRFKPVELTLPVSAEISSTAARQQLTNAVIESADFRAGVIHAAMNQWPRVVACVDIVLYHYLWLGQQKQGVHADDVVFLLIRKEGEHTWRFAGGHAEPQTDSFEEDARREAAEETGQIITRVEYLGSAKIDDWRWRGERDQIKTLVFAAETQTQSHKAGDDAKDTRWFSVREINEGFINSVHHPILALVQKRFKEEFALYAPHLSAKSASTE